MWQEAKNKKLASGLIIKDLPVLISFTQKKPYGTYPYSIIISQACDIDIYCKNMEKWEKEKKITGRQLITQIIFFPAFDEDKFTKGIHLEPQYNYKMLPLGTREKEKYKNHEHIRFHYIYSNIDIIPNFFIDFRQYFTLPAKLTMDHLGKETEKIYKLDHLHYTNLADRFAFYLQRVALPNRREDS